MYAYVAGNPYRESSKLLNVLNLEVTPPWDLEKTIHGGKIPIMISMDGAHHGDSYWLSKKMSELQQQPEVKIVYDRHADIPLQMEGEKLHIVQRVVDYCMEGLPKMPDSWNHEEFVRRNFAQYDRHNLNILIEELAPQLYVCGLDTTKVHSYSQLSVAQTLTDIFLNFHPTESIKSGVTGKKVAISIDIDVIEGLSCVNDTFKGSSGPSLDELCEELYAIKTRNEIVALDIVGFSPRYNDRDGEGLQVYSKILQHTL